MVSDTDWSFPVELDLRDGISLNLLIVRDGNEHLVRHCHTSKKKLFGGGSISLWGRLWSYVLDTDKSFSVELEHRDGISLRLLTVRDGNELLVRYCLSSWKKLFGWGTNSLWGRLSSYVLETDWSFAVELDLDDGISLRLLIVRDGYELLVSYCHTSWKKLFRGVTASRLGRYESMV